MRKALRVVLVVVVVLLALPLLLLWSLQFFAGSEKAEALIARLLRENVDAEVSYANLQVSLMQRFPRVTLQLDSLEVTYPHTRYAAFDSAAVPSRLLDAGRAEAADTLLRLGSLRLSLNPLPLLTGRLRIKYAMLSDLKLYAHAYDDHTANWQVFPASPEKEKSGGLLPVSLGFLSLKGRNALIYTAQQDTVFVAAALRSLEASSDFHTDEDHFRLRGTSLELDSLFLHGRLPADTLAFGLERLAVSEPRAQVFDLVLRARAMLLTDALGRLKVPVKAEGRIGVEKSGRQVELDIDRLSARIAHIPLKASGRLRTGEGASDLNMRLNVEGASLDTLLREYGHAFLQDPSILRTDAVLKLEAEAKGRLDSTTFPKTALRISIPRSSVEYRPLSLKTALLAEAHADVSKDRRIDLGLDRFRLFADGLNIDAEGSAADVTGGDPALKASVNGHTDLAELVARMPGWEGVTMEGRLGLDARLKTRLSRLRDLKLSGNDLEARFNGGSVNVAIPSDTFFVRALQPEIVLRSVSDGLVAGVGLDSVFVKLGKRMAVRATSLRNKGSIRRLERAGQTVTRLDFKTDDERIFLRMGPAKAGVRGVKLSLSAEQRVRRGDERRKRFLDSLQRVYPGTPRDSLFFRMRRNSPRRELPDFLSEKDFRAYDIHISAGEQVLKLLREWSPSGALTISRGFVATPAFPLRTRFRDIDADFDDRNVRLNDFHVTSGTSDLSARGSLGGLFRNMLGHGVLDLNLDLHAGNVNTNELLAAMTREEKISAGAYTDTEDDSAIVTDTLVNAKVDSLPMAVVPANIRATIRMRADSLHFAVFDARPVEATLNLRERTMQLRDVRARSALGNLDMSAYISTKTKKSMSAGVDMKLSGVSVPMALRLFPDFDQMAPPLKTFEGNINCELSATTQLDSNMNVIIRSVDGVAKIFGKDMKISDAGNLRLVTSLMLFKDKNIGPIGDISASASIHDSRLDIYPFLLDVDRYQLALSGIYGLGGVMDYYVSILKSPLAMRFGVRVWNGGPGGKMRYALGKARYLDSGIPVYSEVVDSVQVNIATVIRDIFQKGTQMALTSSRQLPQLPDFEMSSEEREKVEQFILDTRQKEEEEEFFGDFDAWMDNEIEKDAMQLSQTLNTGKKKKK